VKKKGKSWLIRIFKWLFIFYLFATVYMLEQNKSVYGLMKIGFREEKIKVQSIDVSYNPITFKRTIKVIFGNEPKAIYYYGFDFKTADGYQIGYGGNIKNHPEEGKHYKR
jgi:hypothetical protein